MIKVEDYIQKGDALLLTVNLQVNKLPDQDISSASGKYIRLEKPGGTILDLTAEWVNDGTDAAIEYQFTNELDEIGNYTFQGYIEFPGSLNYHSEKGEFYVDDNLVPTP